MTEKLRAARITLYVWDATDPEDVLLALENFMRDYPENVQYEISYQETEQP